MVSAALGKALGQTVVVVVARFLSSMSRDEHATPYARRVRCELFIGGPLCDDEGLQTGRPLSHRLACQLRHGLQRCPMQAPYASASSRTRTGVAAFGVAACGLLGFVLTAKAAPIGAAGEFVHAPALAAQTAVGRTTLTALQDGRLFFYGTSHATSVDPVKVLQGRFERLREASGSPPQVWNPATDSWTRLEPAPECRSGAVLATATLMPDAKVLIAGGLCDVPRARDDTSPLVPHTRLSLWNGASGQWERLDGSAPALSAARVLHTASLLADGSVLVVGGLSDPLHNPDGRATTLTSVQRFRNGRVEAAAALQTARARHTATPQADGSMLVAGGFDAAGQALASVEMWDHASAQWLAAPPLRHARHGHQAALLDDGRILVAGGMDTQGTPLASVEIWDPTARAWSAGQPLPIPLGDPALTRLASGDVLMVGSAQPHNTIVTALLWRKAEARWAAAGDAAGLYQPVLLAASPDGMASVVARSGARLWRPVADDQRPAAHPIHGARNSYDATVMTDGRVLLSGGVRGHQFLDVAEVFVPATGRFSVTGRMNLARHSHRGLALPGGSVVVAGGWARSVDDPTRALPPTPEVWDPKTGLWHLIPGMDDLTRHDQVHVGLSVAGALVFVASRELFGENEAREPPSFRAWRWTPRTGEIERLTVPVKPRAGAAIAIRPDNTVLFAGGVTWTPAPASACASDPRVCAAGLLAGRSEPETGAELWLSPMFGDKPGIVQTLPPMPMPSIPLSPSLQRAWGKARTLILRDNSVLVSFHDPHASGDLPLLHWDGKSGEWSTRPALSSGQGGLLAELPDGQLLSPSKRLEPGATQWIDVVDTQRGRTPLQRPAGGAISLSLEPPHLMEFNSRAAKWQSGPVDASPSWQKRPALVALAKQRVMMIGNANESVDSAHIWRSDVGLWSPAGKLARRYRNDGQAVALASGHVLHLGHLDSKRHVCERWRPDDNQWTSCGTLSPTGDNDRSPRLGTLADGRAAIVTGPAEALVFDEAEGSWHAMPLEVNAKPVPPGAPIRMEAGYYARVQDTSSKRWVDASDLVARHVQRHGAATLMLWNHKKQEWAYVFHDGHALGNDAMWLPDGCAISLRRMRLFNPKTGLITPLQQPLTDVDLSLASAAVMDDGTVVAAAAATSLALPGVGVFFHRKASCSGLELARGEAPPAISAASRADTAPAQPVAPTSPWGDRLRSALSQAWQFRWLALLLMLPMLGYAVGRRHARIRAGGSAK